MDLSLSVRQQSARDQHRVPVDVDRTVVGELNDRVHAVRHGVVDGADCQAALRRDDHRVDFHEGVAVGGEFERAVDAHGEQRDGAFAVIHDFNAFRDDDLGAVARHLPVRPGVRVEPGTVVDRDVSRFVDRNERQHRGHHFHVAHAGHAAAHAAVGNVADSDLDARLAEIAEAVAHFVLEAGDAFIARRRREDDNAVRQRDRAVDRAENANDLPS